MNLVSVASKRLASVHKSECSSSMSDNDSKVRWK
jgi:hypothetical protein